MAEAVSCGYCSESLRTGEKGAGLAFISTPSWRQQPRNTAVLLLSLLPKTVLMQSALVPEGQERGHMAQLEETPLSSGDLPHHSLDEPDAQQNFIVFGKAHFLL